MDLKNITNIKTLYQEGFTELSDAKLDEVLIIGMDSIPEEEKILKAMSQVFEDNTFEFARIVSKKYNYERLDSGEIVARNAEAHLVEKDGESWKIYGFIYDQKKIGTQFSTPVLKEVTNNYIVKNKEELKYLIV